MNLFKDLRDSGVFLDADRSHKECLKFALCLFCERNSTLLQNCGISKN